MKNIGNSSRGRSQGVPKIFRAPMYMAHCAVIFAIAQLSCYVHSIGDKLLHTYMQLLDPWILNVMSGAMIDFPVKCFPSFQILPLVRPLNQSG